MRIRNVTQEAKRAIGSVSPHLVNTGVMTYLEDDTLQRWTALVDFDHMSGPPRFVRESHNRFARGEKIPEVEPTSVLAFCPARAAIVMDHRVWHGGSPNVSHQYPSVLGRGGCRPMLFVHYAAPFYNEELSLFRGSLTGHIGAKQPRKLFMAA